MRFAQNAGAAAPLQNDNHIKNNFGMEVRGFRGIKINPNCDRRE